MKLLSDFFKKENIFIGVLAVAVAVSPSFEFGIVGSRPLEIRLEDIILALSATLFALRFILRRDRRISLPPLAPLIGAWLAFGVFSTLVNFILGNIDPVRSFFYSLKEIEFFLIYFLVYNRIKSLETAKFAVNLWVWLAGANVLWIFYQIFAKIEPDEKWAAYGPGAIGEGGPFPSGGFFTVMFVFLLSFLLYYFSRKKTASWRKIVLIGMTVSLIAGVLASGSRISMIATVAGAAISLFIYYFKIANKSKFSIYTVALLFVAMAVFFAAYQQLPRASRSFDVIAISGELSSSIDNSRLVIWKTQIGEVLNSGLAVVIGYGKAVILHTKWEESHNQYVRNFVDTGVVGSAVFLVLLVLILIRSIKILFKETDPFILAAAGGLFVSTVAMAILSVTAEAFLSVRVSETYWYFVAVAMAVISMPVKPAAGKI